MHAQYFFSNKKNQHSFEAVIAFEAVVVFKPSGKFNFGAHH
jgi:hypothetical protein